MGDSGRSAEAWGDSGRSAEAWGDSGRSAEAGVTLAGRRRRG